jgi:DNA-directed RNA polymerase specialized sigma24 family protein
MKPISYPQHKLSDRPAQSSIMNEFDRAFPIFDHDLLLKQARVIAGQDQDYTAEDLRQQLLVKMLDNPEPFMKAKNKAGYFKVALKHIRADNIKSAKPKIAVAWGKSAAGKKTVTAHAPISTMSYDAMHAEPGEEAYDTVDLADAVHNSDNHRAGETARHNLSGQHEVAHKDAEQLTQRHAPGYVGIDVARALFSPKEDEAMEIRAAGGRLNAAQQKAIERAEKRIAPYRVIVDGRSVFDAKAIERALKERPPVKATGASLKKEAASYVERVPQNPASVFKPPAKPKPKVEPRSPQQEAAIGIIYMHINGSKI